MFFLRVQVDSKHPLALEITKFRSTTSPSNPNPGSKFSQRRGVAHLFRSASLSSLPNPSSRSTVLFVVSVPNYLSFDGFIRFCGAWIDTVSELLFIRSDGMENRYSVLIRLANQLTADGFYCNFNGKKFSPGEAEVCHIMFMMSVEYTESVEIARTPPAGCTELPTCPVCLERLDPDTSGILSTICDHSFQCPCISKRTNLSCQVCRFCQQQDEKPTCSVCGTLENLWVCMICGFVGCGRYTEGHAMRHWMDTQHCYTLDMQTQKIWDYVGSVYVHRLSHSKVDGELAETNSHCMSFEGDCGTSGCSEDSGISGTLFSSKVDAYYESLLVETKSKVGSYISEAVEKAVTSKMHDIQNKLEKCIEEKNAVGNDMSNTHKRSKVDAVATINSRTIVIEHGVLKPDIRVAPFDFIYRIFNENGWLSIFDAVNIYPRLVYEFYKNLEVVSIDKQTPCFETKVCGTTLTIDVDVISEVTDIPLSYAISTPFPDSVTQPSREELMGCFDPRGTNVWEESKNSIPIDFLQSPQHLLARIVMQNIWPISRNSDVPLNRARMIFAIINQIPFCMCKHMIMMMIEMQEDNQIALPFGGLITKILKKKLANIPANEPMDMPEGNFGKLTVMKSNAQVHRFQEQDDPVPSAPSVSSSSTEPPNAAVLSILTQITDRLQSMNTRVTDQFQSMDNRLLSLDDRFLTMDQCIQTMEADVTQIKINVRNTLRHLVPEEQRDQVP
ncbi:BRAP2 RING ZnF UBP domain-containing protein 1-like isoform X3 [Alnus glutinosa]|uniref:BRAP2 RING ZnF UBP domain-containing protein 1-like isoform X3 n=1 Tax=Alnus glutinosa TaxID=3517 RepID=UPI002D768DD1|nr:BRAP2 RING ZnF UBP domain-containing protein 1-like isoform X3 [Alnus glutinosa]